MRLRREDIRRWAPWTGKLLLAIALIALLMNSIQSDAIASVLLLADPVFIAVALLLLPLNLFFQFHKWRVLVHSRIPLATRRELRASLLLGFTFGIVTPARLGEFGGRAAGIRTRSAPSNTVADPGSEGARPPVADKLALIGLTAIDKLATMVITLIAGCCALLLFCWRHPFMDPLLLTALLSLAGAVVLGIMYRWNARHVHAEPADEDSPAAEKGYLRRRVDDVRALLRDLEPPVLRHLFVFSMLFYATFLLQFFFLLSAFGPVDALSAFAGIGTVMLVKTVIPPVTIGELGIREGTSVYVLGHAGILAAAAFNASLLLFAINVFLPSLVGLALLLRLPGREAAR
ncbi:MAG: lysylphosphatidylglycerol synthase domain-containing protein [Bacteroidota bacterium]|jgi:hypothetical protein